MYTKDKNDIEPDAQSRILNIINNISKVVSEKFLSGEIQLNKNGLELVKSENSKDVIEFFCYSEQEYSDSASYICRKPLSNSLEDQKENQNLFISIVISDYSLLDKEIVDEVKSSNNKNSVLFSNNQIEVLFEEKNGIVKKYYRVKTIFNTFDFYYLNSETIDFSNRTLFHKSYPNLKRIARNVGLNITEKDLENNIEEIISSIKLMSY